MSGLRELKQGDLRLPQTGRARALRVGGANQSMSTLSGCGRTVIARNPTAPDAARPSAEWAYSQVLLTNAERACALTPWLRQHSTPRRTRWADSDPPPVTNVTAEYN